MENRIPILVENGCAHAYMCSEMENRHVDCTSSEIKIIDTHFTRDGLTTALKINNFGMNLLSIHTAHCIRWRDRFSNRVGLSTKSKILVNVRFSV